MRQLTLSQQPKESGLRVAYITWNVANNLPNRDEIRKILSEFKGEVDAIVIAEQEGPRSTSDSVGVQVACELKNASENDKDKAQRAFGAGFHTEKFESFTSGTQGAVRMTVISNAPISVASTIFQDPNNKNKGGIAQTVSIGNHSFQIVGAHLESFGTDRRAEEVQQLMGALDQQLPVTDYESLVKRACTPTIFGGDLNCRQLIGEKGEGKNPLVIDQLRDPYLIDDGPMEHCKIYDLYDEGAANRSPKDFTYASGSTHADNPPIELDDRREGGEVKYGVLDRILNSGPINMSTAAIVSGTTSSDHKPVVAIGNIRKLASEFDVVREYIKRQLGYAMNHATPQKARGIIEKIDRLSDTPMNRDLLVKLYDKNKSNREALFRIDQKRQDTAAKFPKLQAIEASEENIMRVKSQLMQSYGLASQARCNHFVEGLHQQIDKAINARTGAEPARSSSVGSSASEKSDSDSISDDLAQRNESSQQKPVTAEVSRRGLFSAKAGYAKSTTSSRAKEQTQKKRSTVDKNPEWKP